MALKNVLSKSIISLHPVHKTGIYCCTAEVPSQRVGCQGPSLKGISAVQLLIDRGANIHDKCQGQSFLHLAATGYNEAAIQIALDHGLKVRERTAPPAPGSFTSLELCQTCSLKEYGVSEEDEFLSEEEHAVRERAARERAIKLLRDACRIELPRCRFCRTEAAHIQMKPCRHQTSCTDCSAAWSGCPCGIPIESKVDVLACVPGEGLVEPAEMEVATKSCCAICQDRPLAVVFTKCGHRSCQECSLNLKRCHYCRGPTGKIIKFY